MTENRTKPDAIGVGDYPFDCHYVQRYVAEPGVVTLEGGFSDATRQVQPYEIPYRALTPVPTQATNLLASVCVSASHVAFTSIRIELNYMTMGEAAGVAAAQAYKSRRSVQQIDVGELQSALTRLGGRIRV